MRAARGPAGTPLDTRWYSLFAAAPWTAAQETTLRTDVAEGHCGKLPDQAVAPIVRAQRMRDAAMAQALVDDATPDGAILIAGNGHVRRDTGVPVYLRGARAAEVVSLGLVETDSPEESLSALSHRFEESPPPYDFVWMTAPIARDDPCAGIPSMPSR